MFKRILVPLDGSTLAENAIATALSIAGKTNAEVILMTSVQVKPVFVSDMMDYSYLLYEQSLKAETENAKHYLAEVIERENRPNFTITTETITGLPANTIIDLAIDAAVDLIVMTTHGRSGFNRLLRGSVTEKVLRHAPCPVIALHSAELPQHVLIPLDGSTLSESILEPAITLAQSLNAKITLTRIDDPQDRLSLELFNELPDSDILLVDAYNEAFNGHSASYLQGIVEKYAHTGLVFDSDVGEGDPADRIIAIAERNGCDLIAMSTHGRTGLQRWRYGSVTEKVLRHIELPMLVSRPSDEAFKTVTIEERDLKMRRLSDREIGS